MNQLTGVIWKMLIWSSSRVPYKIILSYPMLGVFIRYRKAELLTQFGEWLCWETLKTGKSIPR